MPTAAARTTAPVSELFRRWACKTAEALGSSWAFFAAIVVVVVWAGSGPFFRYSDTWQLVINTGTTVVTFLMVFLIQATQNRDTEILNLKIDEILRSLENARTEFVALNELSDAELLALHDQFNSLCGRAGPLIRDDLDDVNREIERRRSQ